MIHVLHMVFLSHESALTPKTSEALHLPILSSAFETLNPALAPKDLQVCIRACTHTCIDMYTDMEVHEAQF